MAAKDGAPFALMSVGIANGPAASLASKAKPEAADAESSPPCTEFPEAKLFVAETASIVEPRNPNTNAPARKSPEVTVCVARHPYTLLYCTPENVAA